MTSQLQRNPDPFEAYDRWRETPRKSIVVLLLSVFCLFTTIGFANDIMAMGREQTVRFALGIILSGSFAVLYAVGAISLRGKWWQAAIPLFVLQFAVSALLANRLPDIPAPALMNGAEIASTRARLTFDSIATIVAVSLGYTGFFFVLMREARRYVKTRTEKALLENEMAAARQVQQVILPHAHHSFAGFTIESVYKPARELGGDFFQILPVEDGGLLFVIGDVAGKGLPAAMLVSMLVGSIRASADDTHDPVVLLRKLHNAIAGRAPDGFATALAALIAADGRITLANAGHLSPYLDGQEVQLPGALPLGISGGGQYEAVQFALPPGGRLTFLSDGVVEAQNASGELFGFDRAQARSRESAASIVEAAVDFGQSDDITLVTIERRANV